MASTLITAPQEYNLTRNPIYVTLESDSFTGSAGAYVPSEDNLSCRLEVWVDTSSGEEMVGRLKAPYSTIDKRVTFEISGLLHDRTPVLPSAASIGLSGSTPYYGEAEGVTAVFRLRHADQYGSPVVAETLTVEGDYLAIRGGLPADAIQDINWAGAAIGLHSYLYLRNSAYVFLKPVSRTQPDWIYFVALHTGDYRQVITIRYDDGTYEDFNSVLMDCLADTCYWVQSGYAQVDVDDYADPAKTVVGYNVSIIRVTGMSNAFTAFYVLDDECPTWERYLLMHNGFGGYESVRMKGVTLYSQEVKRTSFERTRWTDFSIQLGDRDDLRVLGSAVFNTHTGHYPAYYVEHLRQLIHAQLWLIDLELRELAEYRFKRILCETNSVEIRSDIPAAYGFAITYRHAWDDDGFNVY